jgi:hypothetical protein
MRRAFIICGCLLLAVNVAAQDEPAEEFITHGEFAALLMTVGAFQQEIPPPEQALVQIKRLRLVPPDWEIADLLTHGEFADAVVPFGIRYLPVDRDQFATRVFVEAFLRREIWKLRDYIIAVYGGSDPDVSASEFR